MAQNFQRTLKQNISNNSGSATELRAAADTNDAIIGVRCTNTSGSSVDITVYAVSYTHLTLPTNREV